MSIVKTKTTKGGHTITKYSSKREARDAANAHRYIDEDKDRTWSEVKDADKEASYTRMNHPLKHSENKSNAKYNRDGGNSYHTTDDEEKTHYVRKGDSKGGVDARGIDQNGNGKYGDRYYTGDTKNGNDARFTRYKDAKKYDRKKRNSGGEDSKSAKRFLERKERNDMARKLKCGGSIKRSKGGRVLRSLNLNL